MNIVKNWYWRWPAALSSDFCDFVLKDIDWSESKNGEVSQADNTYVSDKNVRKTDVIWEDMMSPIGTILQVYINAANHHAGWNYDISSMEKVQIGKYDAEQNSYYNWHIDTEVPTMGVQRKLTGVVLLNDPDEFSGGELQIEHADTNNLLLSKGTIVVFPSFMRHRVVEVTEGVRYTAVSWMSGPAFR